MNQTKLNDKKKRLIIIISVLVVFIGITPAYVVGQISTGTIGNANVTADTTDNLDFSIDKDINLNPTQFNVVEGGGGLSDTAVGTATLLANSTNDTATFNYYVYFNIRTNNYTYTTEDYKPEIVLTITDPIGQPVTEVSGLSYVTVQNADGSEVSGFDITTKSGLINIASNYEITSNSSTDATEQNWIFTVTFINLTTNQSANGGSTLDAEIILSKNEKINFANYIVNNVYVEDGVNNLYYHDGQGDYTNAELEAGDNSYRYSGGNYEIADAYKSSYNDISSMIDSLTFIGIYINGVVVNMAGESGEYNMLLEIAKEYCTTVSNCKPEEIVADAINDSENLQVNEFIDFYEKGVMSGKYFNVYGFSFSDKLYVPVYDEYNSESNIYTYNNNYTDDISRVLAQSGYLNEIVKNYVCFGSDEETCPADNLYRIIGVFDNENNGIYRLKLVKNDYADNNLLGTDGDYAGKYSNFFSDSTNYKGEKKLNEISVYYWNFSNGINNSSNNWTESRLNTINLNTNFINYLGTEWSEKIYDNEWNLSSISLNTGNSKNLFDEEFDNVVGTYKSKVALMYLSDFLYSFGNIYWTDSFLDTNKGDYASALSNNWMFMGLAEYLLTTDNYEYSENAIYLHWEGAWINVPVSHCVAVRPVFYLNSDVELAGGTGSLNDPYRLMV